MDSTKFLSTVFFVVFAFFAAIHSLHAAAPTTIRV